MSDIKSIADLTPDPQNARRHNPRNIGMIERALNEVGAARSIVVDEDGVILAGNGLVEAAAQAGIERVRVVEADGNEIVAVRRRGLTQEQKTKLALYDNRTAELAEWEPGVLADISADLDLSNLFSADELSDILAAEPVDAGAGGDDFDATPEEGETRTQAGDLWVIGGVHRLIVGDCTDPAVVERLMGGERAALVVTSPPYWVGKTYEQETTWEEIQAFIITCAAMLVEHTDPQGRIIINTGTCQAGQWFKGVAQMRLLLDDWQRAFEARGWPMRYVRCWAKRGQLPLIGPQMDVIDVHWEFIGYFYNPAAKPFKGQRKVGEPWATDGIWEMQGERSAGGTHEAAFPLEIPERNIQLFSDRGDIVWEPFGGSGTTLIAAHRLGRAARVCELLPKYADVILRRAEAEGLTVERVDG